MSSRNEDSTLHRGVKLLHDPVRNQGTAFSEAARGSLGLRGLLPPRIHTQDEQVRRVIENVRRKTTDLERYISLIALQDRNETLFYRVLNDYLQELMPIIYTPTVGKACQLFGHIFRRPRGLFVSSEDRGRVAEVVANWPHDDVRIIVLTDGERILGLGDLGADGMGIPIGKLALYSACAGIHPTKCLPITLDVGTENKSLLRDPLYIGLPRRRLRGQPYRELVDELVSALVERFPRAILQLEDFATKNAFELLEHYRGVLPCFDDDIQGTGAVSVAGLMAATRITNRPLGDGNILFLGAGEAGIGIADTIVASLVAEGMPQAEARKRCWFVDSTALVVDGRTDLAPHKRRFAHRHEPIEDFAGAIEALRPVAIIGVSGSPGLFSKTIVERMAEINERPLVFALSNPTSSSECTARQAYRWSDGRAIFASGSPFDPVDIDGQILVPGQGNNAYIFPGVGLGAMVAEARHVTDEMFLVSARTLADQVTENDLALGRLYPSLSRIREVSKNIAVAVAEEAFRTGNARVLRPKNVERAVASAMFEPHYDDAFF